MLRDADLDACADGRCHFSSAHRNYILSYVKPFRLRHFPDYPERREARLAFSTTVHSVVHGATPHARLLIIYQSMLNSRCSEWYRRCPKSRPNSFRPPGTVINTQHINLSLGASFTKTVTSCTPYRGEPGNP